MRLQSTDSLFLDAVSHSSSSSRILGLSILTVFFGLSTVASSRFYPSRYFSPDFPKPYGPGYIRVDSSNKRSVNKV